MTSSYAGISHDDSTGSQFALVRITLIGPGDLTDDEALLTNVGDPMIGTVMAHFYSAAHASL